MREVPTYTVRASIAISRTVGPEQRNKLERMGKTSLIFAITKGKGQMFLRQCNGQKFLARTSFRFIDRLRVTAGRTHTTCPFMQKRMN